MMLECDFTGLDNEELIELLASLKGMDDVLKEQKIILKGDEVDENEL